MKSHYTLPLSAIYNANGQSVSVGSNQGWPAPGSTQTVTTVLPSTPAITGAVYNANIVLPRSARASNALTMQIDPMQPVSDSDRLPPFKFVTEDDSGFELIMELKPEASISASDVTKLFMLVLASMNLQNSFSAYRYVRSNNLERHFIFRKP